MIAIIAAVAKNGVIGSNKELPWYIPEDLKHFKQITTGKTVLMGRTTYESIVSRLGKPLPDRKNVVLSRTSGLVYTPGVEVFAELDAALSALKSEPEVIVIGGGQIYHQSIGKVDKLYITEVHREVAGDVLFPPIDKNIWKEVSHEDHDGFSFVEYIRK